VETETDAAALGALGVDLGQGWHFGRATAPADLREHYQPQPKATGVAVSTAG
jgi:sensor c-di-GMP phosphodiesterase-like protein